MAFTNRLMTRGGFSDHANVIGSTVRDLVEQERVGAADIRIPHSPVPRLEPARTMDGHGMYTHSHVSVPFRIGTPLVLIITNAHIFTFKELRGLSMSKC